MEKFLVLKSSVLGSHSVTTKLIDRFTEQLSDDTNIIERDLVETPIPQVNGDIAAALAGQDHSLPHQKAAVSLSDQLIDEIKWSDTLIIAAPMYCFTIPSQLKSWFDFIARAGHTYVHTSEGPKGLINNKKAIVVTSRGGIHQNTDRDHVTSYITTVLNFIGIDDIQFVYAEGMTISPEFAQQSLEKASNELFSLLPSKL
ncbi:FMN-dependent NADH-azoreductase [Vibrio ponticus]|uniref:FMN dependent NADH:quinone oxidoreductase n=1 Tax=Vibrio ponticus TaxID=265668 RepID=A0ABX3FK04_9VIBR|nr:NAD(P)H-dependent oxidoreductase [Vibrio ponticus]OLQ94534.1 FMN-dependent NADH-azoreductase [Vibrio ponticus]